MVKNSEGFFTLEREGEALLQIMVYPEKIIFLVKNSKASITHKSNLRITWF